MAASVIVLTFHYTIFIVDAVSAVYDIGYIDVGSQGFGGKFKYLTIWNICLQTLYFGLCALKDAIEDEESPSDPRDRSTLAKFRDFFHASIAFPVGMFVVITFWALYAVDRELVYPKYLDEIIPPWLNHILHTAVMPFILMDKFLVHHHYPRLAVGVLGTSSLAFIYLAWILFIAYYDNFWVYPILQVLETHERALFITVCLMFFASLYLLGQFITSLLLRNKTRTDVKED